MSEIAATLGLMEHGMRGQAEGSFFGRNEGALAVPPRLAKLPMPVVCSKRGLWTARVMRTILAVILQGMPLLFALQASAGDPPPFRIQPDILQLGLLGPVKAFGCRWSPEQEFLLEAMRFDASGRLVETMQMSNSLESGDGALNERFEYDVRGYRLRSVVVHRNGDVIRRTSWVHDETTRTSTESIEFVLDPATEVTQVHGPDGRLIEKYKLATPNRILHGYDQQGWEISRQYCLEDMKVVGRVDFLRDVRGRVTKMTVSGRASGPPGTHEYMLNEGGFVQEERLDNSSRGGQLKVTRYLYDKFDGHGNWLERRAAARIYESSSSRPDTLLWVPTRQEFLYFNDGPNVGPPASSTK